MRSSTFKYYDDASRFIPSEPIASYFPTEKDMIYAPFGGHWSDDNPFVLVLIQLHS